MNTNSNLNDSPPSLPLASPRGSASDQGTLLPLLDTGSSAFNRLVAQEGIPRGGHLGLSAKDADLQNAVLLALAKAVCDRGGHCIYLDAKAAVTGPKLNLVGISSYRETTLPVGNASETVPDWHVTPDGGLQVFRVEAPQQIAAVLDAVIDHPVAPDLVIVNSLAGTLIRQNQFQELDSLGLVNLERANRSLLGRYGSRSLEKGITIVWAHTPFPDDWEAWYDEEKKLRRRLIESERRVMRGSFEFGFEVARVPLDRPESGRGKVKVDSWRKYGKVCGDPVVVAVKANGSFANDRL